MITEFRIALICEKEFYNVNMGSLFHGVLMSILPTEYVEKLHNEELKPFSQSIFANDDGICWRVCGLNKDFSEIFCKAMEDRKDIRLENKQRTLKIKEYTINKVMYSELIESNYFGASNDYITVCFNTPTAYKIDGKYLNYPVLSSIYNNLIRKFDSFSGEFSIYDRETVEEMVLKSSIASYSLKSVKYSLESIKIPAFVGRIGIKIVGPDQLKNLIRLLLKFGEYSGTGIKTAMGMGAIKVVIKDGKRGEINEG